MFYKLKDSIKRKEIGHYTQSEKAEFLGDAFSENSFSRHGKYGRIEVAPVLPELIINKKAKITNQLSATVLSRTIYKVFDIKLLNFLKTYLPAHQYWKINAYKNEEKYEYYILHISESSHDSIAFDKSVFFTMPHKEYLSKASHDIDLLKNFISAQTDNIVQFKNNDAYLELLEKHKNQEGERTMIVAKKVVFDASKIKSPIFRLMTHINNLSGYYVTEELKNKIQGNNFTGMDFVPITELNKVFDVEIINL